MGQRLCKLTEVWVCTPIKENVDGEYKIVSWKYKDISENGVYLNLQQDLNELDRNSTGDIDYDVQKARTTNKYNIEKGDGICLNDISNKTDIKPDYTVSNMPRIGNTIVYTLNKYNGD